MLTNKGFQDQQRRGSGRNESGPLPELRGYKSNDGGFNTEGDGYAVLRSDESGNMSKPGNRRREKTSYNLSVYLLRESVLQHYRCRGRTYLPIQSTYPAICVTPWPAGHFLSGDLKVRCSCDLVRAGGVHVDLAVVMVAKRVWLCRQSTSEPSQATAEITEYNQTERG